MGGLAVHAQAREGVNAAIARCFQNANLLADGPCRRLHGSDLDPGNPNAG
jgi:hypothetical protein